MGARPREVEGAIDGAGERRGRLALEQIEREIDNAAGLGAARKGPLRQQLQVGRLADLARSTEDVDGRAVEGYLSDLWGGEEAGLVIEAAQMGVVPLPGRREPPGVETNDLIVSQHEVVNLAFKCVNDHLFSANGPR